MTCGTGTILLKIIPLSVIIALSFYLSVLPQQFVSKFFLCCTEMSKCLLNGGSKDDDHLFVCDEVTTTPPKACGDLAYHAPSDGRTVTGLRICYLVCLDLHNEDACFLHVK